MRNADEQGRRSEDLQSHSLALLAAVCATPLALLAVADGPQLRLQAAHGDAAVANAALTLCSQALQQPGLLVLDAAPDLGLFAAMPLRNTSGQALGVLAVLDQQPRPLTALQQQALQTLAALLAQQLAAQPPEASWRLLFERNPQPMWIFERHSLRFLAVNEAAQRHYGWSAEEFAAMTLKDIRPADDLPALLDDLVQARDQLRSGGLWRHRRKDGSTIHVDISAHGMPFEGRDARLVLAHDVSHSVAAAQALRDSEARWQRLFAASAIGIAAAGMDGLFSSANPAFCRLVGRDEATLRGHPILAFTHPDDAAACQQQIDGLLAGSLDSFSVDKRYQRPDGRHVWARATVTLTEPSAGGRQLVAVVLDIDAQRQGEQRLRRQAALLDASHDAIIVHGLDHRISAWNLGAERLFGWRADEALGQDLVALLQQDAALAAQARQALQQQGEWAGLVRGLCRDGRALMLDARLTLLPAATARTLRCWRSRPTSSAGWRWSSSCSNPSGWRRWAS